MLHIAVAAVITVEVYGRLPIDFAKGGKYHIKLDRWSEVFLKDLACSDSNHRVIWKVCEGLVKGLFSLRGEKLITDILDDLH